MSFVTLDFETYYAKDYSLIQTKMTTEAYINDPQFEVIGVSIKIDDAPAVWYTGTHAQIQKILDDINWSESALLCHNTMFDGAILKWRFDCEPAFYYDTLCMARATHGHEVSISLANLAKLYSIGEKGNESILAIGKKQADFTKADLDRYGEYCKNDTELTYKLFHKLAKFPQSEYELIHQTLLMFIKPVLKLDTTLLEFRLTEIQQEKSLLLGSLKNVLKCETEEDVRKKLSSNPQFAAVLKSFNIPVPLKISPTTGKEITAFAKTDLGFIALESSEDPFTQQLCAVRLGTKATMEESRITNFIEVAARTDNYLPVPLTYYGAHTGRWSGKGGGINLQNLPARDKTKNALKKSLVAPAGHVLINADSSQIEARIVAWLAGETDLLNQFRNNEDVYSKFASRYYRRTITEADVKERFLGKTCIAEGSLVLCRRGWIPIEQVKLSDKVWDGEEWVCHKGVVLNGLKETLSIYGLWLTPDHLVWSGTQWLRAESVVGDENILSQVLGTAADSLPSLDILEGQKDLTLLLSNVIADGQNIQSIVTTSKTLNHFDARNVDIDRGIKSTIGYTSTLCLKQNIEADYLIGFHLLLLDAIQEQIERIHRMVVEVLRYLKNGVKIELRFLNILKPYPVGTIPNSIWTEQIIIKDMSPAIYDLYLNQKICVIKEKSQNLKQKLPVYDLLSCGPRNRFTVLTDSGPIIVHNCMLGLQYGTGYEKLFNTMSQSGMGVVTAMSECREIVNLYRSTFPNIPELWKEGDKLLRFLLRWPDNGPVMQYSKSKLLVTGMGIVLPNDLYIRYNNLQLEDRIMYNHTRNGRRSLWGATVLENVSQALARIVIGEQLLKIAERYRVVLTVHDSVVLLAENKDFEAALRCAKEVMSTSPVWAPDLPVSCKVTYGSSYGDC